MTINISGNFQPPLVDSGKALPLPKSKVPSTNNELTLKAVQKVTVEEVDIQSAETKVSSTINKSVEKKFNDQIESLKQFNQNIDRTLQFKIDDELGVTIVRVLDKDTEELIRQFPPEELLNLSRRLNELNDAGSKGANQTGVLLQEKV